MENRTGLVYGVHSLLEHSRRYIPTRIYCLSLASQHEVLDLALVPTFEFSIRILFCLHINLFYRIEWTDTFKITKSSTPLILFVLPGAGLGQSSDKIK